ncbi:archaemetzincin [Flavobacterium akiainvivens]|uniref:archaemetzincin n=1 Tax=Flavobacterium akiainvivens TaxID=1202724 RepID=UPI0006C8787F|nr:archaemetzincin [Flavobacterium akiainvivens]SFQ50377.1 archaemetzincin [Flavobacterium akiainvivens]
MKYIVLILAFLLFGCKEERYASPDKDIVVGLLPYKGMDGNYVSNIETEIEKYYNVKVSILEDKALPQTAFINIKSPRYRADSLIAFQKRMNLDVDYIMGLTHRDISITKHDDKGQIRKPEWRYNDFGIMGLAYCPGNSAVVSYFQLKTPDKAKQFGRFKKVTIHELGHNFGLPHCPDKKCVMTDAVESIKTVDNANPWLCAICKNKLNL